MNEAEVSDVVSMPGNCQCLQIAAVDIVISHDPSVVLCDLDPIYHDFFVGQEAGKNASRILARLVMGKMPDLSRMQKIFDTRESWSFFADGRGFWISFHPARHAHPFWIARFSRLASRVIVYCPLPGRAPGDNEICLDNPICYPLDQLLLMYYLAYRDGLLVHAAGIELQGRGMVFAGCSGAGKSTWTRLFAAAGVGKLLSDERVVLRRIDDGWQVFGTPWAGTEGIAGVGRAPLTGIFFLKHGERNRLRDLGAGSAMERLLPMVSIPWYDPEVMERMITFAKHVLSVVPAYELTFKPERSAVDFFCKFLRTLS
jgi:hypothetical protein